MRLIQFGAAAATLLAELPSAQSAWEQIRWGVLPETVIAASRRQAQRNDLPGERRVKRAGGAELRLKSFVVAERDYGGVTVQATFWFDEQRRLLAISEEPANGDLAASESCGAIETELRGRYGEVDLLTEKEATKHLIWRDENAKTRIHFWLNEGADCAVEYRQLRGPLDR